ncbi:M1 family metallopeptidase [Leadbetterella sp. DM7]|uniref:M1 family metallopeptidase n=1 Tax=Leadbetterella sp. DM7 TaxID=3235085 RepID=UPI00349ECC21
MLRLVLLLLFLGFQAWSQNRKIANYTIEVSLDPAGKMLQGKQRLTWTNTSTVAVNELRFHTYLNAFKDTESTFMKGSGGMLRNDRLNTSVPGHFGYIKINRTLLNGSTVLTGKYIQPDNLNDKDQTVMLFGLPSPVQPGETLTLDMDFTARLPRIFARTGWAADDYFFAGQWFPKIGVLEKSGTWNCHQFHANTEFFSDFGEYRVNITLPRRFTVAGTGSKIAENPVKGDKKVVSFRAEDVHDFAWAASPHFIEVTQPYRGITLRAYLQPEHKNKAARYFDAVTKAIDYMEKHVGRYPYKTLSLIDPSKDGSGSGGMEYPTLISCGATWGAGTWVKDQEVVTIHEFVHQYFQGMLASNEFEDSWMDEGFTQYMEGRIMDFAYPKGSLFNFLGFTVNDAAASRWNYVSMKYPAITAIRTDTWKYPGGTYPVMSYTKPATVLQTLQNLVGDEVMDEILQTYFERFKFRHPVPRDFFDTANEIARRKTRFKDLDWFFEQTILGTEVCDYAVQHLENTTRGGSFRLVNLGDMHIPVTVRVTFSNGRHTGFRWEGKTGDYRYPENITAVEIDPGNANRMDINLLNNSLSAEPQRLFSFKYAAKMLFWIQNVLQMA